MNQIQPTICFVNKVLLKLVTCVVLRIVHGCPYTQQQSLVAAAETVWHLRCNIFTIQNLISLFYRTRKTPVADHSVYSISTYQYPSPILINILICRNMSLMNCILYY